MRPALTALALCMTAAVLAAAEKPCPCPWRSKGIPSRQPALLRVIRPTAAEMTPPGSEKFIVFARENLGPPPVWDPVASAWEIIPSSPSPRLAKRVEFAHSSWSPYALSWPEYVMLGVNRDDDDDLDDRIYRVDYRTWDVRLVATFRRATERAADSRHLYLWTSAGSRRPLYEPSKGVRFLDRSSGELSRPKSKFTVLDYSPTVWVVRRKSGPPDRAWVYRPDSDSFGSSFALTRDEAARRPSPGHPSPQSRPI